MSQASSPCIGLCTLDEAGGVCLGCGRSLDEIGRWGGLSEPERSKLVEAVQRAVDKYCTVSRSVTEGTPVEVDLPR